MIIIFVFFVMLSLLMMVVGLLMGTFGVAWTTIGKMRLLKNHGNAKFWVSMVISILLDIFFISCLMH